MIKPRWFSPSPLPKYPGLGYQDAAIVDSYLRTKPAGLVRVSYSVPVGQGRPQTVDTTPAIAADWKYLTSLKVDAIFEFTDRVELCEIKPNAGAGAIGQLLCYNILMRQAIFTQLPIYNVILTDDIHPDVALCAGLLNIRVRTIAPPSRRVPI